MKRSYILSALILLTISHYKLIRAISQEEVDQFINSDEFTQLFGEMSDDEKQALAIETMKESQNFEPLPSYTTQDEKKPTQQVEKQPKAVSFDSAKLTDMRKLIERISELIENVDLQFAELPRVSSNNVIEKKWAQVKEEIPFVVATLKAISKKNQLLEKLMSNEYSALKGQVTNLQTTLEQSYKNLAMPEKDAAVNVDTKQAKQERKQAKRRRNKLIEVLHSELSPILSGVKGLLEKYAPEVLKESKIKMPKTRSSRVESRSENYGWDTGYGNDYTSSYDRA